MNPFRISFVVLLLAAISPILASAANIGYCTDNLNRNYIFRLGTTEKQGMALKISGEKLQLLKGKSITALSAAFGSKRTTGGTVDIFIATSLDDNATPLASKTATISSVVKWLELPFDAPYTITGNEGQLYIGYTANIDTNSSILLSDNNPEVADGTFYFCNGSWVDALSQAKGNASVRAVVADLPSFSDIVLKPISINGYFNVGGEYPTEAQIFNFGSTPVSSFDVSVQVGDNAPTVNHIAGVSIAPNTNYSISIPPFSSSTEGYLPVSISVSNVAAEQDITDNTCSQNLFFYPRNMERAILLEGFTGQECSNCPAGHATIDNFLHSGISTPVVEIMHHAGYSPDRMTMDQDLDYTYFYGSSGTFAPALMINRLSVPSLDTRPVLNVSASNLAGAFAAAESIEPYVSLALKTSFNPTTRSVTVDFTALTHKDLPAEINTFNVVLTQDGIIADQKPYTDYTHNAVFRGALTGNAWGIQLTEAGCKAGGVTKWSHTFTLPQAIFADYWQSLLDNPSLTPEQIEVVKAYYSFEAIPANIKVVAYVGAFNSTDINANPVYNAVAAPLGGSYTQGGISQNGDVDGNGKIDINDLGALVNIVCGLAESTPGADVDGDGKVDVNDLGILVNTIVGL